MNLMNRNGAARRSIALGLPTLLLFGLASCGESGGSDVSGGGGGGGGGGGSGATNNSVAIVIDSGPDPTSAAVQNLGYVTVTVCVPGTSTCQTIDHVQIDTGSVGFRVLNAAFTGGASGITASQLPAVQESNGNTLAECVQYVDGFTFGSVRTADVKIAGEVASGIEIQIVGDLENSIPPACNNTTTDPDSGGEEDTIATFGANGILGVQQFLTDNYNTSSVADGTEYSSCTTASPPVCTAISLAPSAQVPNPVAKFTTDNNGVVIAFPTSTCNPASVPTSSQGANPSTGGASCSGTLYFGIGTQTNNVLPSTLGIYTIDADYADPTFASLNVTFNGVPLPYSYIDAGTSALYFPDNAGSTPALCSDAEAAGLYCPSSLTAESQEIQGFSNGTESSVSFSVGNADAIIAANTPSETTGAFQPFIAGDSGASSGTFVDGLPFFYGRTVYVGFQGSSFGSGNVAGPIYAF